MTRLAAAILALVLASLYPAEVRGEDAAPPEPPGEQAEASGQAGDEGEPDRDPAPPRFRGSVTVEAPPVVEENRLTRLATVVASVSARQVDDLNAQDLAGALRRVPGVVVSRYNPVGAYGGAEGGAVYIRGHGSSRPGAELVTMVDGVPRFVGVWTHPLLDTLSLDPAGRLDVYRSPQPVLLGSMAFGAVDVVPRERSGSGHGGRLVGSWGSFDTSVLRAEYGWAGDRSDLLVTASRRASDGHRENADGEVEAITGRFSWALDESWAVSLNVHHTDAWAHDPGVEGAPSPPVTPRFADTADLVIGSLGHRHRWGEGSLKLFVDDGEIDWLQWDAGAGHAFTTFTDWRNRGARLRETLRPWQGGEVVVGFDWDRWGGSTFERRPGGDRPTREFELETTAPYAVVSHTFGDRVKVTPSAGARFIQSREFGDEWGLQAGVVVEEGPRQWYANAARGVNLPGVWVAVFYANYGRGEQWRELEPERVDHLEVGVLHDLGAGWRLDLSLFSDDVTDALRFVPPPPPPPAFANVGDYSTAGVEASLHGRLGRRAMIFLGATLTDTDPADVPNAPETTLTAGLAWSSAAGWRLNLDAEWVDEQLIVNPRFPGIPQAIDAYGLVNGRLGVPLRRLLGIDADLFVAVENLLDESYQLRPGYPMPGRGWTVGLDASF